MSNPSSPIDLGQLFQTVVGTLANNKASLNNADTNNHDHGDNMVNTFELITRAIKEKKGANPSDQLAHAAEILSQQKSGSAQLYAKGLSQASQQFQGQQVTSDNAMTLIPTLLGIGEAPVQLSTQLMISPANLTYVSGNSINFRWKASPGAAKYWLIVKRVKDGSPRISKDLGDVLFSDEHGFANDGTQYKWTVGIGDSPDSDSAAAAAYWTFTNGISAQPQEPQPQQAQQQQSEGINDIIGTLIRKAQQPQDRKQSKANSGINQEAIVSALVSNSAMGGSYRSQSGSLVANTLITAVQNMVNKK